jgi:hypothetical protein
MAVSEATVARAMGGLKSDVAATLGASHEADVDHCAEHGLSFLEDDARFTEWLVRVIS